MTSIRVEARPPRETRDLAEALRACLEKISVGKAAPSPDAAVSRPATVAANLRKLAALIDQTLLRPEVTRREIEQFCRDAADRRFGVVCVSPTWVPTACRL